MSRRYDYSKLTTAGRPLWDPKAIRPDPDQKDRSQKKHFLVQNISEISREDALKGKESWNPQIATYDYPRNLTTRDIPGAYPQKKVTKNGNGNSNIDSFSQRGRELESNHHLQSPEILTKSNRQQEDSLDRFAREYNSKSVQPQIYSDKKETYDKLLKEIELNNKMQALRKSNHNDIQSNYQEDYFHQYNTHSDHNNVSQSQDIKPSYEQNPNLNIGNNRAHRSELLPNEINRYQDVAIDQKELHYNKWRSPEFVPPHYERQANEVPTREKRNGSVPHIVHFENARIPERNSSEMRSYDVTKSVDLKSISRTNFEPKKVFTYNIIANRPIQRDLPSHTKLPYKYAMEIDPTKRSSISPAIKAYGLDQEIQKQEFNSHQYSQSERHRIDQDFNSLPKNYESELFHKNYPPKNSQQLF